MVVWGCIQSITLAGDRHTTGEDAVEEEESSTRVQCANGRAYSEEGLAIVHSLSLAFYSPVSDSVLLKCCPAFTRLALGSFGNCYMHDLRELEMMRQSTATKNLLRIEPSKQYQSFFAKHR